MGDLRAAREEAFWPLWRRWKDDPKEFARHLLDELDALDQAQLATGGDVSAELVAEIAGEPAPAPKPPARRKPRGGTAT